jgi:hypothetical protein
VSLKLNLSSHLPQNHGKLIVGKLTLLLDWCCVPNREHDYVLNHFGKVEMILDTLLSFNNFCIAIFGVIEQRSSRYQLLQRLIHQRKIVKQANIQKNRMKDRRVVLPAAGVD